ncbi:MAG: DUF885 domain-containing protein [Planctomycetota bacterium]|nr:DUF885 domain-containing protein [Planctomycetota bacterium]
MRLIFAAVLFVISLVPAVSIGQESIALKSLLDDAWEFGLQEDPIFATHVGDHRFNDKLSRESIADQKRRLGRKGQFFVRWESIDRGALSKADRINFDIFGRILRDEMTEMEFEMYLMPISNRWGFHVAFPELPQQVPLNDVKDYENYTARLREFSRLTDDNIELMRVGIEKGLVLPAVVLEGYKDSITAHIVDDPTKSLLYKPFEQFPNRIAEQQRERLATAGREAIAEHVALGYQKFLKFMQDEYVPNCRGSIAASALPLGRDYYRHRVRMFTTLDVTPDEVHATGQREVERIRAEMDEIIKRVGFEGDFAAFVEHLRKEPRFYAETPEQLMKETAFVLKKMDGQLPKLFKTLPRTPYGIREIPAYIAPKTTTAYYQQPAGDGSRAGFYYVNTYNLKSRPLYGIEALSLHEAVPGHHLQLALQQELTDMPAFRRFSPITAFIEGWGLYAERLGLEVGFYEDPYSDFGRLTYENWRACRLVVDTGMHYFGWTRQQAIEFMASNTALSMHNIEAEVDRYISWPGQALAYKTGELKIRELRARAEAELGARFDIREFHEVVLGSGAIPLDVLEGNVNDYMVQAKAEADVAAP